MRIPRRWRMKQWRVRRLLMLAALAASQVACTAPATQEQSGMIVGGLLGGVVGSQVGQGTGRTVATVIGTLIGANIGGNVGRSMDESDRLKTAHALETVRTSVPTHWVNPDTRNQYTVIPTSTVDTPTGPCREYTMNAVVGGRSEKIYGTACRQTDGSWKTVQ
ncbi:MAG: hypothetical protein RL459_798 [Pseudomonadota bacterium]|jgi:surface antigen